MKCTACGNELKQVVAGDVSVDVCEGGCGGMWFDHLELLKFDEPQERGGEALLDTHRTKELVIDENAQRKCPRCTDKTMLHSFYSVKRQVQVDQCPKCGGIWLDVGELATIRTQYASEGERKQAAEAYFDEIFGEKLVAMEAESEEKAEKAHRFARIFRFICPSYYIPGKQRWGAF